MYEIKGKTVRLKIADYIEEYYNAKQFIEQCQECKNYGKLWTCPPFNFDPLSKIKVFKYIYIIGNQIFIDKATREKPVNTKELQELSYKIVEEARNDIDKKLLNLEKEYPNSLCFFAGSCLLCTNEQCARHINRACFYPFKMRSSLEAYGFDVSKTSLNILDIELKWSNNLILPQYFTLISALCTNHEIANFKFN